MGQGGSEWGGDLPFLTDAAVMSFSRWGLAFDRSASGGWENLVRIS